MLLIKTDKIDRKIEHRQKETLNVENIKKCSNSKYDDDDDLDGSGTFNQELLNLIN